MTKPVRAGVAVAVLVSCAWSGWSAHGVSGGHWGGAGLGLLGGGLGLAIVRWWPRRRAR